MNTTDHPSVVAYLDAVARETAGLPAERRAELLADLREHIEVSGAGTEERLREVLAELGEPRTVAASALAEEPYPATTAASVTSAVSVTSAEPARPARSRLTVALLASAGLVFLLSPLVGGVVLLAGLVLLWGSPSWSTRHKLVGTATSAAVPLAVLAGSVLLAGGRLGPMELLVLVCVSVALPAVGALTLLRALRA
ncbi:HAAS signaling domain-containing protein [Streptomyces sp. NPDC101115]|uniref:HAAS signaling domain-containing protein n=1 Tax=Streptomyces sp. NPDC101115 TaxID=3366106 RepID=UPI003816B0B7